MIIKSGVLGKDKRVINTYECDWCHAVFDQKVGTGDCSNEEGYAKKVSSQVPCVKCGNFLRTWE